ncbi:unnamed protein product [Adineta ricciae]|uniref:F-box domain-containing protein n=1 Tax=Adineta ricciae TaxID=249248 RepID=A0A813PN07_ADIRI|nr:unnamed protein product [Adineta ricciae]CAF0915997.1 unnamed protein product [Adineta ricciae]
MTSNSHSFTLSTLPNELLYRILGILDNQTILFSFRLTCRRFYSIAQTYNHYQLDFRSVSKPNFRSICRSIHPGHIVSLTLSNENQTVDQIKCFLSSFPFQQMTRLRSLILLKIDYQDFHTILQALSTLSSLSVTFSNSNFQNFETLSLLSSIISGPKLRSLTFDLSTDNINQISWSKECLLQSLTMSQSIGFTQLCTILSSALQLKKIVLQDCIVAINRDTDLSMAYTQLISLTLNDSELDMNGCESLLSVVPSLEHFRIIGGSQLCDGLFWENLIKKNLLKLTKFEFGLPGEAPLLLNDSSEIQKLIASFRTAFWLEVKQWFVTCYYFKSSSSYCLYSLPICKSNVKLFANKDKLSYSTYSYFSQDISMTDNINEMQLNLTKLMAGDKDDGNQAAIYPYFRNLTKLLIDIDDEWPMNSVEFLSSFINLSHIVNLTIRLNLSIKYDFDQLLHITHFFDQTSHLQSLVIDNSEISAETICSLVPHHVRHFQVTTNSIQDMKLLIEQMVYLWSITFEAFSAEDLKIDLSNWLAETRPSSTLKYENSVLSIWLDRATTSTNRQ